jgi:hypothetical protein
LSQESEVKPGKRKGAIGRQFQSLSNVFVRAVGKECAIISYFDFGLYNNTIWFYELIKLD